MHCRSRGRIAWSAGCFTSSVTEAGGIHGGERRRDKRRESGDGERRTGIMQTESKAGIAGGLVMSLVSLNYQDLIQTSVCAAVGATVSYIVTYVLRSIKKWDDD